MSAGQKRHPTPQAQSHVTDGAQGGFHACVVKAATVTTTQRYFGIWQGPGGGACAVVAVRQRHAGAPRLAATIRHCTDLLRNDHSEPGLLPGFRTTGQAPPSHPCRTHRHEFDSRRTRCRSVPASRLEPAKSSRRIASAKRAIASSLVRASDPANAQTRERRRCSISWSQSKCIEET